MSCGSRIRSTAAYGDITATSRRQWRKFIAYALYATRSCLYQRASNKRFVPDVAVVGPRYINIQSEDDSLGFDRSRFAQLPLLVLHNKMYDVHGWLEVVGNVSAKLAWTRAIGAAGAFTWLTRHHEFTRRSGVPHHWMPFGVDVKTFGALAVRLARRCNQSMWVSLVRAARTSILCATPCYLLSRV